MNQLEQEARKGFLARRHRLRIAEFKKWTTTWRANTDDPQNQIVLGLGLYGIHGLLGILVAMVLNRDNPNPSWVLYTIWLLVGIAVAHFTRPTFRLLVDVYVSHRAISKFSARELILEFLSKRVEDMEEDAIGGQSQFNIRYCANRDLLQQMNLIQQKLEIIVSRRLLRRNAQGLQAFASFPESEDYLVPLLHELSRKTNTLKEAVGKAIRFRIRVEDLIKRQLDMIERLREPLDELEVVREANVLIAEVDGAIEPLQTAMVESMDAIERGFTEARDEIRSFLENSGVALAIEISEAGSSFDLARLEQVIESHVPAAIEE